MCLCINPPPPAYRILVIFCNKKSPQSVDCELFSVLLSYRDSNPKRQNQNLLCYHYTIAQSVLSVANIRSIFDSCKNTTQL